ncbi:MAG: NADH-quinone oxidoreductase subunit M [Crocinitomicaceae bacterium]|nr:NADH-quinone oxidoreductase subunit M [Crocinitomicaceae bacterium]
MELLIIPFVFALVALVVPKNVVRVTALIGGLISLVMGFVYIAGYTPAADFIALLPNCSESCSKPFFLNFGYDGIGLVMVVLTSVIIFLIFLSNYDNERFASDKRFNALIFFMQFALIGVFLSLDGLLFYIFWELSLIPVFLLFLWYGEKDKRVTLMKFFIYTFIGSLAMLFSLLYIRNLAPSFSIEDLIAVQMSSQTALWVFGGFMIAFAVKIPLFPLHAWQPDTYTKSPMAGTMLLGALMLKMALFGMIRWMISIAPEALSSMTNLIVVLGLIGVIYAAILAIKQNDMKKIFAYASVSHVGLIAAGIIVLNLDALTGAMVQIVNHALVAVGLFLAADIIERRLQTRNLPDLGGIAKQAPMFGFWFAVIIFATISIPFTSGFIGEFFLIKGVFGYNPVYGGIIGTTVILACVYSFRAYQASMFGPSKNFNFPDLSWAEWTAFFIISILILFLGVYPQALIEIVTPSLQKLIEIVNIK